MHVARVEIRKKVHDNNRNKNELMALYHAIGYCSRFYLSTDLYILHTGYKHKRRTGKYLAHARHKHIHIHTKKESNDFFILLSRFFLFITIQHRAHIYILLHSSQVHKQEVKEENESKRKKNNCRLLQ